MIRPVSLFMLLALVVPLAACTVETSPAGSSQVAGPDTSEAATTADTASLSTLPKNESLLFALQAEAGELEAEGSTGVEYTLTLEHASRQTTWFTDRPTRDGGTISTESLVADWASLGFEDVPPNAVLTHSEQDGEAPLIVELGTPTYDSDERTLSLGVQVIGRSTDDGIAGSFGPVSLFIDNATLSDGCGYTGEIDYFPESVTPAGYVPADGSRMRKESYPELYAVLGDRFGSEGTVFQTPVVPGVGEHLHALVCAVGGADPAETDRNGQQANSCIIGRVQLFAQEEPVYGHALANGQELPINKNSSLFGYSGNRFGGDGVTTFGVPNMTSPPGTSNQVCTWNAHVWDPNTYASMCYLSEVSLWATWGLTPADWYPALPAARGGLLRAPYQDSALFSLLKTTFGGDGKTTFALPTVDPTDPNLTGGVCGRGAYPAL